MNEINGVRIGDVFNHGKYHRAVVVDIIERHSMVDGSIVGHECHARALTGQATNNFHIPFSTVVRNRIDRSEEVTELISL